MIAILDCLIVLSGVARAEPTSALPLTFQALPSPAKQESCDSITN